MPLCSGGHLPSVGSISCSNVRQSAGHLQRSSAGHNRNEARRGHLIHIHGSSNVLWRHRGHSSRRCEAWSKDRSHTDASSSCSSSSSNDEQSSNGMRNGNASSPSPEREASSSESLSDSTEASTSSPSSISGPALSAHEQIGERYPVLGKALDTKDAVGASRDQPQAVFQAFLSRTNELCQIGAHSVAWTAAGLTQLITKPILPRSAYIAELRKAVQAEPSNAEK